MTQDERNPSELIKNWLALFQQALTTGDLNKIVTLFADDSYWRDLTAFTWNIKTMEGREQIREMLQHCLTHVGQTKWQLDGEAIAKNDITEGWFTFETAVSRGRGIVRLRGNQCWTLLTTMRELKGFEEARGFTRSNGVVHGSVKGRQSWLEQREQEAAELGHSTQPYVVIIGGGQAGIVLAARLKQLNVPTLVIEKNERPGDSWRKRYKSLCLHDPVWYDHLPYIPFPENWPIFSPKDKMGDWLEMYTRVMEINYWTQTEAKQARYDENQGRWEVRVEQNGNPIILRPVQLVLATGMSGVPNVPDFPGQSTFAGEQFHSSQFHDGTAYAGKHCIVLGANNSAHDICAHLWENDAHVTMIQRSATMVARSESLMEFRFKALYSEWAVANGIDTDKADLIAASYPYRLAPTGNRATVAKIRRRDADFYRRLEAAGFMLTFGEDETGIGMMYRRRGSGYYIDVGASELIANGEINLESRTNIREIKTRSVVLENGQELPADVLIYATGYGSMNGWAARLISQEVADKVGKVWGYGSDTKLDPGPWEGELRNMWKPTHQARLWFHGGNLAQVRHFSLYLALQLKARYEGLSTPVYGMEPVHHLE